MALTDVKLLLGITDSSKDDLINYHISAVQNKIMATCFIDTFPAALDTVVTEIVVNRMKGKDEGVKSIQRSDTTTIFRDKDEMEPYQAQLAYYKRVRSL